MAPTNQQTLLEVVETEVLVLGADAQAEPAVLNVAPQPFLDVFMNGERVTGRRTVYAEDKIQVQVVDTPFVRQTWVDVTPDGLQATLHIQYEAGIKRTLRPIAASADVHLIVSEAPLVPAPFELSEIQTALQNNKVTYQIDFAAIAGFLATQESGECVCAVGTPVVETISERYEILVAESNDVTLVGIIPINPVISILEGTVFAVHQPRVDGTPGTNVRGELIPPEPVVSKLPIIGKGAERLKDGRVMARRAGRVVVTTRLLDVAESFVVERNLQATDGYIVFDGDVIIRGDVEEGTEIVAGGQVFVSGSVSRGTISADDGVVISGGAFGCTLQAGLRMSALLRLSNLLSRLQEELNTLVTAVEQVHSTVAARGADLPAGKIAAKLLDDRFDSYRMWPKNIEDWLATDGKAAGAVWSKFVESLTVELSYQRLTSVRDVSAWKMLSHLLNKKVSELISHPSEEADIQVRNAQNARLQATGSIISTNQGYYQCDLTAGKAVRASGNPGAILACTVFAQNVFAREIGSHAETNTTIQLHNTDGSVNATTVHPGTVLAVGTWRHKVPKEMKNVTWP